LREQEKMKVGDLVRCPTLPRAHPLRQEYRIGIITFTIAHSIREIRGEEDKKRGDTIDPK
jgi:hypothetical protein